MFGDCLTKVDLYKTPQNAKSFKQISFAKSVIHEPKNMNFNTVETLNQEITYPGTYILVHMAFFWFTNQAKKNCI